MEWLFSHRFLLGANAEAESLGSHPSPDGCPAEPHCFPRSASTMLRERGAPWKSMTTAPSLHTPPLPMGSLLPAAFRKDFWRAPDTSYYFQCPRLLLLILCFIPAISETFWQTEELNTFSVLLFWAKSAPGTSCWDSVRLKHMELHFVRVKTHQILVLSCGSIWLTVQETLGKPDKPRNTSITLFREITWIINIKKIYIFLFHSFILQFQGIYKVLPTSDAVLGIFSLVISLYNSAGMQVFWLVNEDDTGICGGHPGMGNRLTQMPRGSGHTMGQMAVREVGSKAEEQKLGKPPGWAATRVVALTAVRTQPHSLLSSEEALPTTDRV